MFKKFVKNKKRKKEIIEVNRLLPSSFEKKQHKKRRCINKEHKYGADTYFRDICQLSKGITLNKKKEWKNSIPEELSHSRRHLLQVNRMIQGDNPGEYTNIHFMHSLIDTI